MKDAARNCTVEGTFRLAGLGLEPFFEENDLDYADETTLTRIITPAGKSRMFVNDVPVSLAQMRELGSRLVDIHSQHQNLILSSEEFRTTAIDTVAGNGALLERYGAHYTRFTELQREVAALREAAEKGRRDEEWLRFQVLRNALDADETGILVQLKEAENALMHIGAHYPAAEEYAARLRSTLEELKDIGASAAAESERIDADPERLAKLSARLDALIALQQKYRVADEGELLALRDRSAEQLAAIVHGDERIAEAEAALETAAQEARTAADKLHAARTKAAEGFAERIRTTLAKLGMAEACFEVEVETTGTLSRTGGDSIRFLFTANRDRTPQPVERIASGGELSRVMLALKALLAERMQLPTILFDEIDTGVSGRIADAMGEIIAALSATMQVVDITHLPQVASKGAAHFVVYKRDGHTSITRLTDDERITEIAKMLSGSEITDAAIAQARILLGRTKEPAATAAKGPAGSGTLF